MKWLDESELPANITVDALFQRLCSAVDEYPIKKWKTVHVFQTLPDPIYVSLWILYFDAQLAKSEICHCIRDSYILEIKQSFRIIGDNADADLLDKISDIFPADMHIFPDGGWITNSYRCPTEEDYAKGRELGKQLFQVADMKTLVKAYLKKRLCWKLLISSLTRDDSGNIISREEEYQNCHIALKSNKEFFLDCNIDGKCYRVPCISYEKRTELFEKIQEEIQQFVDSNPTEAEKEMFHQKFSSKYLPKGNQD